MKKLMLLLSLFAVIPAVAVVDVYDPDFNYYDTDHGYARRSYREECPGGVCPRRGYVRDYYYRRGGCPGGRCPRGYRSEFYPRYYREEAPVVVSETVGMAYPYGDGYWGPKYVEKESKETLGVAYPYGDGYWGPKVIDND